MNSAADGNGPGLFRQQRLRQAAVEEEGSDFAATVWDGRDAAVASRLAYPEVRATLAAAGRSHRLESGDQRSAEAAWEDYWAATRSVELTERVTAHASHLAGQHALRGVDAVHLASLLAVGVTDTLFAVWDRSLRAGALSAGVQVAPWERRRGRRGRRYRTIC